MICDANETDLNDNLKEEMCSDSIVTKNLQELPTKDWWNMVCQISCLSCHSENVAKITDNKMIKMHVANVAKPFSLDITSSKRISVKINERYADCSVCNGEMIRLISCDPFPPKI